MMLPNVQRAKVESKSQPGEAWEKKQYRCYQMYKELKLKANHNRLTVCIFLEIDVTKCTKS